MGFVKILSVQVLLLLATVWIENTNGHGMLLDPVNRASRWRYFSGAPANYDDNGLNCGGYNTQHFTNGGRCGYCGDNFSDAMPRNNELGGYFGQGVIVKTYTRGQTFNALVRITANHMGGRFEFKVCNLDVDTKESDACFDKNGVFTYTLTSTASQDFVFPVTLPNITCKRCVLQWTYIVANSWGYCPDGSGRLGCGPQETFRTCSDISIL